MSNLLNATRTALNLLAERLHRRFPVLGTHPRGVALAGAGLLILLIGLGWSLMGRQGPAAGQVTLADTRQRISCQACDYDQAHPLAEIRTWRRDPAGFYACPSCGRHQADRFRTGGVRVMRPRPAAGSPAPPSGD